MKIKSGKFKVLHSGFINSPSMEDLEFIVNESPEMTVVVRVKQEKAIAESSIELNVEKNNRLVISYQNPAIQLNFGTQDPVKLGSMDGKELFASIRISIVGDYSSYQVSYTFFLVGEENAE